MPTQGGSVSISNITDGEDDDEENKEEFWFKKSSSANVLNQTSKKRAIIRISKMEVDSNDLNEMEALAATADSPYVGMHF